MKKTKFITKAKRLLSGFVATAIAVSMLPTLPAMAEETTEKYPYTLFAGSSEEGAITVNAGNFCVNGNVATNGTIVSSGNMNINGTKTENAGEETIYILKKLNYAYFSGDNVDVYPDDYSYEEMNININDPMTVQGELELTGNINLNTGIKALEDVNLTGEVKNTNSSVICSETGDIVIDSTNVNLNGLVYAPYGDVEITAQNLNLNNVIIIADTITFNCPSVNANYSSSMAELVGTESDVIVELFAFGEYNAEMHSIDIEWYTNYTNSDYQIWFSDDNNEYALISSVSDATTYQYDITEEFEKRYFKVTLETNYGEIVESIPFVITKTEDGYFADFLDSDGDELPDIYENMIGTDLNNSDTDEDGLTDYQEIYITETDPTKYDSVIEGVSDAAADSDSDGLSNLYEIELGTNPIKSDTDKDSLSDYEEVTNTGTAPLNPDTDNDTIPDGDEIKIGLDPSNPETFGVPDAEYKIAQTISADSEVLSEINTSENPYKLSIDITAAGYVEGNLTAKESSYSKSLQNDSMLGIAPELIYSNSSSIDNVTLKFEISSEYVENTLNIFPDEESLVGIKRLNVFKYFEDINMLLPIETFFDVDNNVIYTNVDELGTYCVMDMELWLNSFDVPEEEYLSTPMLMSLLPEDDVVDEFTTNDSIITFDGEIEDMMLSDDEAETEIMLMSETPMLMSLNTVTNVTPIDVAFLLQSSGQLENTFTSQKTMILDVMEKLIDEYGDGNVRFCVVTYNLSGADMLEFADGEIWFTNYYALREALNAVSYTYTSGYTDRGNAFRMLQNNVDFRENASKFIFQVMNGSTDVGSMYFDQINTCSRLGINYSELMPSGYYYVSSSYGQQVADAIASTNGMNATYSTNSSIHVYNHICEYAAPPQVEFNAIVPTGWKTISLKGILDSENGVNSDDDTLTDWKEVMTEKLSWDTDGTVILPTIQECISYATKPYAEEGLSRFKSEQWVSGMPSSDFERYLYYVINNTYILPIYSDPTEEDSDGDNIIDHFDINKLAVNNINEKFVEYINNEYITMDSIHSTDDGFSICLTPLCDILTSMNYPEDGLSPEYYNESSKTGIPAYFDDWYLFNIEDSNSTSYSIIKLREKEAGSYSSVAIPFIAFNMDLLSEYSEGSDTTALQKELKAVTQGQRLQYDKVIIDYFADNSSEALNMIADIYINIIISQECSVSNELVVDTDEDYQPDKYAMETLEKHSISNADDNEEIYDAENNLVKIKDTSSLTLAEKQCILAIRSSNPSINSFTAEIVYHADMTKEYEWAKDTPFISKIYKAAIKADMGIGEEPYGFAAGKYKDYDGEYVVAQRNQWGDM